MKILDLLKQKPKLGCRPLAERFKETSYNIEIGKLQIAKYIKNKSNIRRKHENFEGDMKRKMIAKYDMNNVLYEWYIKCCQAGIYPDRAVLQE